MSEVCRLHLTEIPPYTGEAEIPGIRFRPARAALGVSAWGMNVIELDANVRGYPTHDHAADGQEEVYVVLSGRCTLELPDGPLPLGPGDLVRVGPAVSRKLVTGDEPVVVLALGNTPGRAYTPPSWG
jgi:mannose-6-phosphate isomerase-like protein (cupin superfamily)